jgi:hypothetical protein
MKLAVSYRQRLNRKPATTKVSVKASSGSVLLPILSTGGDRYISLCPTP